MAALGEFNYTSAGSPLESVWTVTHNLGTLNVAVDAIILNGGSLKKVMPFSIVVIDTNTVKITFSSPQSGFARIVAGVE
jgi:hypothetical protein